MSYEFGTPTVIDVAWVQAQVEEIRHVAWHLAGVIRRKMEG